MTDFLIFYAPPLTIAAAAAVLFIWGAKWMKNPK